MRILITDDQARRYGRLVKALETMGIERDAIQIASCANDARELLAQHYYDLLVLDIMLPLWPDSDPSAQNSLDLLFELQEEGEGHKPGHIIGITADKEVMGDAASSFGEWTWAVVEYSESADDWLNRVINCVSYLQDKKGNSTEGSLEHKVDLAIICALESPELSEVLKLPWNWSAPRPLDDVTFVRDGHFSDNNGRKITVCATFASRMGMVSTAVRSAAIISLLRPRLITMCGICAGVRGKTELGDVLFADPAWDYQSGKWMSGDNGANFLISPHQLCPPTSVRALVEQIRGYKAELAEIATRYEGDERTMVPRIFIGPVASGSAVLSDGNIIDEIKKLQHRDLLGVEMEIYGMYAAALGASKPQPIPFALKAVCDFADPNKQDQYQRYAAYTSANVLRLLMEKFGGTLLG